MIMQSLSAIGRVAGLALLISLSTNVGGKAAERLPFDKLAGQWTGNGTIELSDGTREPIRCRASYDVLDARKELQLNIRCASQSYNFDLRGSAHYAAGAITGTWSEETRNAAGTIAGTASGDTFKVRATGPSFSATLTLTTRDDRQSVVIQSQESQAAVKRASISLRRGG